MTIEVKVPRFGEVRIGDVRAALGDVFLVSRFVDVLVLASADMPSSTGRVHFVDKRSGRGVHRRLACPRCHQPRSVLFADGAGGLGCARCTRHRTRRQLERTCRDYRHNGGQAEDLFFRMLTRRGVTPNDIAAVAMNIVEGDRCRWRGLQHEIRLALSLEETVEHEAER